MDSMYSISENEKKTLKFRIYSYIILFYIIMAYSINKNYILEM